MYYRDHAPPHFHAIYGEHEAEIEIASGSILVGKLPRRASNLVAAWLDTHRREVQRNWGLACQGEPLVPIEPLE